MGHGRVNLPVGGGSCKALGSLLARQRERADISAGKESADDISPRDRQIEVRRVRLVVVNREAQWARAA